MSTKPADARVKLTKSVVDKLTPPASGQRFVRDTELKGFAVRITPTGTKSFVLEKRIHGRVRRLTLGRFGELTIVQARQRAQQLLGRIAMGEDPVARKRAEKALSITLAEAYRDYLAARPRLRPKTRMDYDRAIQVVFADWQHRPLRTITRSMIAQRHQALARQRGEQGANNYMRVLRAIFSFAIDRYEDGTGQPVIGQNPVLVLTRTRAWYPMERRRTVLKTHQLSAWYQAVESLRASSHHRAMGDTVADFLLFLLFTGLRRNEAAALRWTDVDLVAQTFTVAETKSHRPHSLPFGPYVRTLLVRRCGARQNGYVFAGFGGRGHLVEPKRQIAHVIDATGIAFTMHDLRRTFLTVAEAINLSAYTIKRLANHSLRGDVTAGYIVSDVERLRTPMEKIEYFLSSALGITREALIISLPALPRD